MFIRETLKFVVDILKVPSVLVGLIALIGLLAQKIVFRRGERHGKTILGFIVLGGGATVLVGSLNPLGGMFEHAFNIQGIIPNNEAIVSIALEKYGASTALIMAFGMVANIVVARFTRLKYIFLTGHHTFYMACMIGIILTVAGFEGVQLVFTGALTTGLVMAFFRRSPSAICAASPAMTISLSVTSAPRATCCPAGSARRWAKLALDRGDEPAEKPQLPARQLHFDLDDHDRHLPDHGDLRRAGLCGKRAQRRPELRCIRSFRPSPSPPGCSSSCRACV